MSGTTERPRRFQCERLRHLMRAGRGLWRRAALAAVLVGLSLAMGSLARAAEVVIDFEQAEIGKRVTEWVEQGVVFKLAHEPTQTKAPGRLVFFPYLGTERRGILCAMAMEPIPVEARFPQPVESVTVVLWGSTGCAARLEALDERGNVVDVAAVDEVPRRKEPGGPVPNFELTVRAEGIAAVRFSGPRPGEYLAADEVRVGMR